MEHGLKCKTKNYRTSRKNWGEFLRDLGLGKEFLDLTQKARFIEKNYKLDPII